MNEKIGFKERSDSWVQNNNRFAKDYLEKPNGTATFITNEKVAIAQEVYAFLQPVCDEFIGIACGRIKSSRVPELAEAICIDRLLGKVPIDQQPEILAITLEKLIDETFYLGIFSHLYIFKCKSRTNIAAVNIVDLEAQWQIDTIIADKVIGYYGDRDYPVCMQIWEYHFNSRVFVTLKKMLKIGFWRKGRFISYFRNLYLAGVLLIMRYDQATTLAEE